MPFPTLNPVRSAKISAARRFHERTAIRQTLGSLIAGFATVVLFSALRVSGADALSAGFIYDSFPLTLTPGHRTEAAGPFYYHDEQQTQETWAVPPLFAHMRDPAVEREEFDFAYPLFTYTRFGGQYRVQFFQLLSWAGGESGTETYCDRFTLFPIYFRQRSSDPSQNYTAFVPFYGHLQRRMFHDEIFFVMFPFYATTRKKDMITDNYVYPFYHQRHGPGLTGWQLWPFYGTEHKEPTIKTNSFGDQESVPAYDHKFVMWPFYFNDMNNLGTDNPSHEAGVIPFYTFQRSGLRDSSTVLWPFFWKIDDREKKYHEWDFPWPFFTIARGEGKYMTRFWPIFSQGHTATLESDSYLWPVFKYDFIHSAPLERKRRRVAFFLFSDILEKNTETGKSRRQTELFPLFARRREFNGNTRLQVLAILEPFLRGSYKIERDYSHVYSIWRSEKNPETGAASQSLLWNLYRRDVAPERKKVSALFGLFQYRSAAEGKQVRILYIPFNSHRKAAVARSSAESETHDQRQSSEQQSKP